MRTEPYQSRHCAVTRRFLNAMYGGAARTYGLRVIFVAHAGLDNIITIGDVWGSSRSIRSSGPGGGGCL
jgi:hypothetical protein